MNFGPNISSAVLLGVVFNNTEYKKSILKLRRFAFNPEFLKIFYTITDEGFIINCISGECLKGANIENI